MQKFHRILQIILLVYFAGLLLFFISFDTMGGLVGIAEVTSDSVVKILLTGLVLFLISWLVGKGVKSSLQSKVKKMENEMNALKAKIYDFEHPKGQEKPKTESTPKPSDSESSNLPPRQNFTE
ncbi:hypothetical protein E4S40_11960 [Algoriphagus kandeliae]|uniref:Uncharacterized protein n=1 Tax=Algoriphagus kandeliae TaxID=2562278 RepID=A0A4Y9QR32_9BACT|nr:hypothetical protein [Algoriphagus kandeliae]TFV94717.1 hypothetical protein E4S40_11960 [Algoriphagus kandeliae]